MVLRVFCHSYCSESPPPSESPHVFRFNALACLFDRYRSLPPKYKPGQPEPTPDFPEHWINFYPGPVDPNFIVHYEPLKDSRTTKTKVDNGSVDPAASSSGAEPTASSSAGATQVIMSGMFAGLSPPPATVYHSPQEQERWLDTDSWYDPGWDPKADKWQIGRSP